MRYIDADKLIAEIERRLKIVEPYKDTFESAAACRQELIWMKEFITSLPQEQPEVDLEREIQEHIKECLDVKFPTTDIELIKKDVAYTARKFYELGLNARKEDTK